jgi:hypothetical protein
LERRHSFSQNDLAAGDKPFPANKKWAGWNAMIRGIEL